MLLSEWMGYCLFYEGMLDSVLMARLVGSYNEIQSRSQDIGYLSFSPSEKSDKFTTSLAWLRHAARVNQTGIEALLRRLCLIPVWLTRAVCLNQASEVINLSLFSEGEKDKYQMS